MTEREALKLALEALEAHADIGIKSDKAITAIKEALAQPEQEPVAYSYTSRITGAQGFSHHPMPRFMDSDSWDIKPLYTTPPQRTSVGLTDVLDFIEEFTGAELERHPMFSDGYDLALSHVKELVEAKLKEKNSA